MRNGSVVFRKKAKAVDDATRKFTAWVQNLAAAFKI